MWRRKKSSGGQALVMITLALVAMAGMMGLAVDLGWSYYVQKTAQSAADSAALGAVQEAFKRLGGSVGAITFGTGANAVYQQTTVADCATIQSDTNSNLWNGCRYAENNGFSSAGNQRVTMQADSTTPAPTAPGVNNIKYWVTTRTVQTIPQLFSSLLGNTQGTVSAIATAAIAGTIVPGSFYGINREGDCLSDSSGNMYNCGVDIDLSSAGNAACTNVNGSPAGVTAKVCAPAGMYLSSSCNGGVTSPAGCTDPGGKGGTNYAGQITNGPNVWANQTLQIRNTGDVNNKDTTHWQPLPTNSTATAPFEDLTKTLNGGAQPSLASSTVLPTCGLLDGGSGGNLPAGTYGAYQYFSYHMVGSAVTPTGRPINIGNNSAVTFSSSSGCPGLGSSASGAGGSFGQYIFYGGLSINGNNNTSVAFGAGQYVMAGSLSSDGGTTSGDSFFMNGGTITGDSSLGTMFITTDSSYGGALDTQTAAIPGTGLPTLYQGSVDIKNSNITLTGVTSSAPSTLSSFQNYLLWSDRRNSNIHIDPTTDNVIDQNLPPSSYHRTNTSPRLVLEDGNGSLNLTGVLYQPRGAWIELKAGTAGVFNSHMQIVTGALTTPNGSGSSAITLLGPSAPTIIYVTSLIQ